MLMLSVPPATMMSPMPAMICWAARAIVCRPDEQKRLTVWPGTACGRPARMRRDARHVQPLLAFGHRAADDHVLDLLWVEAFSSLDGSLDRRRRHIVGPHGGQTAAMGLADRRARAAYDDCFSHCNSPGRRSKVIEQPTVRVSTT